MRIFRSFLNAISMYSALPVAVRGAWKKEDLKYSIVFFPAVGALIGLFLWLWSLIDLHIGGRNLIGGILVCAVIPAAVTGGIHIDGYMDTSDALHSWRGREKKLEILKDSHIGAFAVIRLLIISALYIAGCSVLVGDLYQGRASGGEIYLVWCLSFILSRVLSGLSAVNFKNARGDGMLYTFSEAAASGRRTVNICLAAELFVCAFCMLFIQLPAGLAVLGTAFLVFWHYRRLSYREFGGITGDLAGWFLVRCETAMVLAAALVIRITR